MSAVQFDDIRNRAVGHWPGILAALGIEVSQRHGPCPGCGGTDRFRFDDKDGRGTWICSGGGADLLSGDGFDLVAHARGCTLREALDAVAGVIGAGIIRKPPESTHRQPTSGKRSYGLELWMRACRADAVVAQHPYLIRKGFRHAYGAGVAEVVRSRRWEGAQPCVVVPIREHGTGKVIAVQAINPDGQKVTFGSMTAEDGTPGYLLLGNDLDPKAPLFVAEGWADVVSLVFIAYRGNAGGAVAFGKSRLDRIADQLKADTGRRPDIMRDRS